MLFPPLARSVVWAVGCFLTGGLRGPLEMRHKGIQPAMWSVHSESLGFFFFFFWFHCYKDHCKKSETPLGSNSRLLPIQRVLLSAPTLLLAQLSLLRMPFPHMWDSLVAQTVKNLPAIQEAWFERSPGEGIGNPLWCSCVDPGIEPQSLVSPALAGGFFTSAS